jgi:hypothetical protein
VLHFEDFKEAHIFMISIKALHLLHADTKQAIHHGEHTADDFFGGEVGTQLLLRDIVFGYAQLFAVVGAIPALEICAALLRSKGF